MVDAAHRRRHHALRHRRRLRQRRAARRRCWARRSGARRDEVIVATKFGMDMRRRQRPDWGVRGSRRYIRLRRRGQPAPARHGLDRPLPAAHARPAHADRGDPGRAGRAGRPRARSATSAPPTSPAGRSSTPTGPPARGGYERVHLRAERVLLARPRRRGRAGAGAGAHRRQGLLPYFPLARGPADRQVPAGASRRAAGHPARPAVRRAGRRPTSTRSRRSQAFADERGI